MFGEKNQKGRELEEATFINDWKTNDPWYIWFFSQS